jgi:hypothetical protein
VRPVPTHDVALTLIEISKGAYRVSSQCLPGRQFSPVHSSVMQNLGVDHNPDIRWSRGLIVCVAWTRKSPEEKEYLDFVTHLERGVCV